MTADPTHPKKFAFWCRQFSIETTRAQKWSDVIFGVLLPVLCLAFDPIVFKGSAIDPYLPSPLARYRVFAYLGITLGILALAVWLAFGERIEKGNGFFAGVFLCGTVFSLWIGIVLLPYSLLGLIAYGLGLLGFTPFVTALIYFRNAVRIFRRTKQSGLEAWWIFTVMALLGLLLAAGLPGFVQWQTTRFVEQSVQAVLHGDPQAVEQGMKNLRQAFWCTDACFDRIVLSYRENTDDTYRWRLSQIYEELTGKDILFLAVESVD